MVLYEIKVKDWISPQRLQEPSRWWREGRNLSWLFHKCVFSRTRCEVPTMDDKKLTTEMSNIRISRQDIEPYFEIWRLTCSQDWIESTDASLKRLNRPLAYQERLFSINLSLMQKQMPEDWRKVQLSAININIKIKAMQHTIDQLAAHPWCAKSSWDHKTKLSTTW